MIEDIIFCYSSKSFFNQPMPLWMIIIVIIQQNACIRLILCTYYALSTGKSHSAKSIKFQILRILSTCLLISHDNPYRNTPFLLTTQFKGLMIYIFNFFQRNRPLNISKLRGCFTWNLFRIYTSSWNGWCIASHLPKVIINFNSSVRDCPSFVHNEVIFISF